MDEILMATLISEGSRLLTAIIRANQEGKRQSLEVQYPVIPDELPGFNEKGAHLPPQITSEIRVTSIPEPARQGEKVATSCVGCAIGHLATCSGLLKEAVRFAPQGMNEPHIIQNLNICLDELNAMERVDLQPSKIVELPDWERDLAHKALETSRETRHFIESGILSGEQLEKLSANLTKVREEIGSAWLQQKLRAISQEDKDEIQRRVMKKLETIGTKGIKELQ